MFKAKDAVFGANATGVLRTWEVGAKAAQAATIKERTTKLSLAIVNLCIVTDCKYKSRDGKQKVSFNVARKSDLTT
jgi:hypothetical protein